MWAFIGLTLALTIGLLGIGAYQKRAEISANWSKYRHDPLYMFFAYFFKPDNDPRTRLEFATDSFKDEINYILDGIFATMLAPIFKIFKLFTDSLSETGNGLFTVKTLFAKLFEKWNQMVDVFVRRFNGVFHQTRMTFIHLFTAMERMFGIAASSVYTGISTVMAFASFLELVIIIMIVILAIIFAMMIFLFWVLWPIAPVIAIGAAIVSVAAGAAAGAGGAALNGFCFTGDTMVDTISGPMDIADITIGMELTNGGVVTGTIVIDSSNTELYSLFGVRVSGTHIIIDEFFGPIHVKDHIFSEVIHDNVQNMYCLITSNRTIPVITTFGVKLFSDWEEISEENDLRLWHKQVFETLNGTSISYNPPTTESLASESVFSGTTHIWSPTGPAEIRGIRPGNVVMDANGKVTRVTGVVKIAGSEIQSAVKLGETGYAAAGAWIQTGNVWAQPQNTVPVSEEEWYSVFTESGTFRLLEADNIGTAVRDFSDIGIDRIEETYDWVLEALRPNQNLDEQ